MDTFKLDKKYIHGITLNFDGIVFLSQWLLSNKKMSDKETEFCQECLKARSFNRKQKVKAVRLLTKYTNVRLQDTTVQLPTIRL